MNVQTAMNGARMAAEVHGRLSLVPGFREFAGNVAILANYASTSGWEDSSGKKTEPGAKPIGMAQWGAAIVTAGMIAEQVPQAGMPTPGADPLGFVWLTWEFKNGARLELELHADLLAQRYEWTNVRDGMPARHSSNELREVVEALRSVMVGASSPS